MYAIDDTGGLWQIDHDAPDTLTHAPCVRPAREGAADSAALTPPDERRMIEWHRLNVDPTDSDLADLDDSELSRFDFDRATLLGVHRADLAKPAGRGTTIRPRAIPRGR